ncbi:MAG TPA: rhodanese-like domain-containing protein [Pyrinomonadaceae bacterium]|nr:rhodanese-like domain-containing protein [Pyrinomonadaceae bacterium]
MRNLLVLMVITAGLVLAGCNSAEQKNGSTKPVAPSSSAVYADGVRRVTPSELQALLTNNEAVVIDVRTEDAYKTAHIRGAKLIPETEVGKRSNELPKDKLIVTYCS